jgi:hypothetical protein
MIIPKPYLGTNKNGSSSLILIANVTICLDAHENCSSEYIDSTMTYIIRCRCYCHFNQKPCFKKELDPIHHIRSEASELKEQEDQKLNSEKELIWSNDLNISSDLQRQKNGVNNTDESECLVHRTKVVNAENSFDGQGSYPS